MNPAVSHVGRLLRERGVPHQDGVVIELFEPPDDDPPPPPPDEPEGWGYPDEYVVRTVKRAGHPPRLWLKGKWRELVPSIPWSPLPMILTDLDRETRTVPQAIEIVSMRIRARIEGFFLDELAERLNEQHVVKIFAYCPIRWPGKVFAPREPKVTSITSSRLDDDDGAAPSRAREPFRAHLVEPEVT